MSERLTVPDLRARKGGTPMVMLTACTAPFARILDPHCDALLVGDSLGMVLYSMDSTLPVTLDMMIAHGRAVAKTATQACVIVDMPFGTTQASPEAAFNACARVMAETGCDAIKLEGGREMEPTLRFLTERGIPVMGHVGLMPQRVAAMGGYGYRGRDEAERFHIWQDAMAVQRAGAFALVLEGIQEPHARKLTAELAIPTFGIGASPACDGQVLVSEDMAGLTNGPLPRFVQRFGHLGDALDRAAAAYAGAVRAQAFPGPEHCYGVTKNTPSAKDSLLQPE